VPRDAMQTRPEFGAVAHRYRAAQRRLKSAVVGFAGTLLAIGILRPPQPIPYLLGGVAVAFWLAAIGLQFRIPPLSCPNCEERLDRELRTYCPECGKHAIDFSSWRSPSCTECHASLTTARRSGRLWTIRWCTVCGELLDERGV
jgi:hypothetical protein